MLKKIRNVILSFFLIFILSMTTSFAASSYVDVSIDKNENIVLSFSGDQTSRTVTWWVSKSSTKGWVTYSNKEDLSDGIKIDATISFEGPGKNKRYTGFNSYEVKLNSLSSGTYYYKVSTQVGDEIVDSEIKSFVVDEKDESGFSFIYMGDAQYKLGTDDYDSWLSLLQNGVEHQPSFVFMGGDMVNDGQVASDWNAYLNRATKVFSSTPMLSVPGNHECNDISTFKPNFYKQLFSLPQNGPEGFEEEFYSFDYNDCHITALNSDIFEQLNEGKISQDDLNKVTKWIEKDIKKSDAKWKIVVTHHPVYTVVSDSISKQVFDNWESIFTEAKVDLVLCGHQHIYMRTYPMNDGKIDMDNGVVNIMSVSSKKNYSGRDLAYSEVMLEDTPTYQLINVEGDNLNVISMDESDNIVDEVTLYPKDRAPYEESFSVTFDPNNGEDKVIKEVKSNETLDYTPSIPEKEGYVFIGWYKDTDDITTEYKNEQIYQKDVTYKAKYAHVQMLGAQGKLVVNNESGIRFGTKIYTDGDEIVEKGTLIVPANLLAEGEALTLDTPKVVKSVAKVNYDKTDEYITYLGTLVGIPQTQFERQITAAAYVIYKDKAGNQYTVYSQYPNGSISVYDLLGNNANWNEQW